MTSGARLTLPELHEGMRAWARGAYEFEAGVELLIRSGMSARIVSHLRTHDDDAEVPGGFVWPDVAGALTGGLGLSGGEVRLLSVAANLLGQELDDAGAEVLPRLRLGNLAGLDRGNCHLVLAALSHALGAHQQSAWRPGQPLTDGYLPALVEWPEVPRG